MAISIANVTSLQEAREALHVSVSQLKSFLLCPARHRFQYVLRAEPSHRPSALAFGSAIHEALAAFYRELAHAGTRLDAKELAMHFDAVWDGELAREPEILFGDKESAEGLRETGHAMLAAFGTDGYVPAEIVGIEVPFSIPIPGREEVLVGAFDLVGRDEDGRLVIVEHKTAARRWSDDQLQYDIQATAYTWAARELGLGDVDVVFQVLLKTKKPAVETYRVQRHEADILEFVRVIDGVMRAVEAGAWWPSRGWLCSSCSVARYCGTNEG